MKFWVYFSLLCLLSPGAHAAVKHRPVVVKKTGAKKASTKKSVSPKRTAGKSAVNTKSVKSNKSSGRKTYASRKSRSSRRTTAKAQPVRQAAPSSDRYKEIQEALVAKGYMTTPPNGQWDQNSQDAMRKFQSAENLSVSGKLSSRSIIALGLGSPSAAVPPATTTPAPASTTAIPPKQ